MALFRKTTKGISPYELKHDHIMSHFDSVLSHHSHGERERRRAALHTALNQALDVDPGMQRGEHGVIQAEEFEQIVTDLHKGGLISESEAKGLRSVAQKPLRD